MLDILYHLFNFTIAVCYFSIFLMIFTGLVRERKFGRNQLGTATSGIFFTCAVGHFTHAATSHASWPLWSAGLQVMVDGWTILPAVTYLILRHKYGLIIRGPDMILEYKAQLAQKTDEVNLLREVEQLKDDFLAMISHELRTPLTAIKGYAQLLLRRAAKAGDTALKDELEAINRQVDTMTGLVQMLLDVGRMQSGKFELSLKRLEVNSFLEQVVKQLQMTTQTHRLNLRFAQPGSLYWVEADAERLEQVVNNLVTNAVKYSPKAGQVDILLEEKPGTKGQPSEIWLQIRDYGEGISEEEIPHIFERFYRSPTVRNSSRQGLGLGLYICQQLVQAMGGEINVTSVLSQGSIFTVRLPSTRYTVTPEPTKTIAAHTPII